MKKLVVLTGAGISAESGFETFRDAGGLWEKYPVEKVATPEGWMEDPNLVTDFYNHLRRQLLDAKPNAGHYGLADLEQRFDVTVVTQNVDDLHERAGSSKVIHLHGELLKVCSSRDPTIPVAYRPSLQNTLKWLMENGRPTDHCCARGLCGLARPSPISKRPQKPFPMPTSLPSSAPRSTSIPLLG